MAYLVENERCRGIHGFKKAVGSIALAALPVFSAGVRAAETPVFAQSSHTTVSSEFNNCPGTPPKPTSELTIPKLDIVNAPVRRSPGTYCIYPGYGVSRYGKMLFGHDDINGSIFEELHTLQNRDIVHLNAHKFVVYSVNENVDPNNKTPVLADRWENAIKLKNPKDIELVTCGPWWVDIYRVVVKAKEVFPHPIKLIKSHHEKSHAKEIVKKAA